jgi:hypothetical protein
MIKIVDTIYYLYEITRLNSTHTNSTSSYSTLIIGQNIFIVKNSFKPVIYVNTILIKIHSNVY